MSRRLIIGCGNPDRGDDAAGLLVAQSLQEFGAIAHGGDAVSLLDLWGKEDDVVLVDAAVSGSPPGTIFDWEGEPEGAMHNCRISTHAFGLADTMELARVLGRMPRSLRVVGIEGAEFAPGAPPSEAVKAAATKVAAMLTAWARSS